MAVISISSVVAKLDACQRTVHVEQGDTCDKIGADWSVSTYQIEHVNSDIIDANCDNLKIGEVLCLGIKGQDCKATYVVKAGDTCDNIVESEGISLATLLANNPNTGSDCFIHTGEVLCVADCEVYKTGGCTK
ncbi:hypothetical protein PILCRDRAFT_5080 [Piloderma croceum F 1598]|uniref:LysM domain-containing protein n=1 Tax=Piloderma croceum (strain F 1598) TaxID=765440 RepID=A0A0C3BI62_PILCF|nr:hypothetical protein PILCRDRAFT_5080 [Piloderma croceum F 1598]